MLYLNNDETAVLELEDLSIEIEFPVLIINPLLNGLIKFLQGSQSFSLKMVSSDLITYYLYFDIYDITIIKSKNNHIEQFKYATSIDMIKEIYNSVSNDFGLWLLSFSSSQKEMKKEFIANINILKNLIKNIDNCENNKLTLLEVLSNIYNYTNKLNPIVYVININNTTRTISIGKYFDNKKNEFIYTVQQNTDEQALEYNEEQFVPAICKIPGLQLVFGQYVQFEIN